jgi:PAS domain S-box-containing protein
MAEGSSKLETVVVSKDHQNISLSGSVNCSFENDQPIEFRTIFHDITDRVRTEKIRNLYYSIANQTILSSSFAELYDNIHSELNNFLDAKNCYIALFDHEELIFPFFVLNNERQPYSGNGPEYSITAYALKENKALMIKEHEFQGLAAEGVIEHSEDFPTVWIGAPLMLEHRTIGLIALMSYKRKSPFDRTDLEILDFMSGQIALAIDRKRTEEKVNNQTARLNAIFESSSHLIWSINRNYEFTSFNQNYSNIIHKYLGSRPKPNEQFNISTNLPTSHKDNLFWIEKYQQVFNGESLHFETKFKGEFGSEIWLDIFLNPIYQPDGSVKEVSGIAHDITDKKRSGLALRESEKSLETYSNRSRIFTSSATYKVIS